MKKLIEKMKKGEPVTILALGNSIVAASYLKHGFVYFLEKKLREKFKNRKIRIINAGLDGEIAQRAYKRLYGEDLFKCKPDLVLIMYGHNERDLGIKPEQYEQFIGVLVKEARKKGAEAILLTPNRLLYANLDKATRLYLKKLEKIAKEEKILLVDVHAAFEGHDLTKIFTRKFPLDAVYHAPSKIDWIHPNELGHKLIAEKILEAFKK